MKQVICSLTHVSAEDEPRVFPIFGREVRVSRTGDRILADANNYHHLGGPLECKDGAFVCPWHGARFDMADGRRIDGPALVNAELMYVPTRIEGEELVYVHGEPS